MGNQIKSSIQKDNEINKNINIIGLTYNEAKLIYPNLRVIITDDIPLFLHKNYSPNRCNVIIRDSLIIKIDGFY